MRFAFFYHSLYSDWNHGNAHFLRGIVSELLARGHDVRVFEPRNGWSLRHLLSEEGPQFLRELRRLYPACKSRRYELNRLDLRATLRDVDVVLVHEWNMPELVQAVGDYRGNHNHFLLFFHDTHHRMASAPQEMAKYDLSNYDGILAFGEVISKRYRTQGWGRAAFTWHEAADVRIFRPLDVEKEAELVWIGNWGDGERSAELHEFLLGPAQSLGLRGRVHGVRYPDEAKEALSAAGLQYSGWLANYRVPEVFAHHRVTVHVPRRYYREQLPGIPTIRVFEALACGVPLACAEWQDTEALFHPGEDYLVARDGTEMKDHLRRLLQDPLTAKQMAQQGLETIRKRHTCAHRVDELLEICERTQPAASVRTISSPGPPPCSRAD